MRGASTRQMRGADEGKRGRPRGTRTRTPFVCAQPGLPAGRGEDRPIVPQGRQECVSYDWRSMASTSVFRTATRAKYLSLAGTMVQGAWVELVLANISSAAAV